MFFPHLRIYASRLLGVLSSAMTMCYVISSFAQSSALIENTIEASQKPRSIVSIPVLPSENDSENTRMTLIRNNWKEKELTEMEMATHRCEASTNVSTIWLVKFFCTFCKPHKY